MSRTIRYYGQNSTKDYAGMVKRRKNRAVKQTLRSTRIVDVQDLDAEKFLDFASEERSDVRTHSVYED